MKRAAVALLAVLGICPLSRAAGTCFPVLGSVLLEAEAPGTCTIVGLAIGPTYLQAPGTCFRVRLRGALPGTGFAGLTAEAASSLSLAGSAAASPLVLWEGGAPPLPGGFGGVSRQLITARSVLNVPGGALHTSDAGLLSAGGVVEQVLVTGGTGLYRGATGSLLVTGDSTKDWAPVRGQVCVGGAAP